MSDEQADVYLSDSDVKDCMIVLNPGRPVLDHTWYGFCWLPEHSTAEILVERVATINGRAILRVSTEHDDIEICVSPAGRSIRVWRTKSGRELKDTTDE